MRFPGGLVRGPVRPDRWSALRFASLRWAALPIVDRRWTVPMAAIALGFGLFVGVAIGPGAEGSLGTTSPMIVRVPAPSEAPQEAVAGRPADHGHAGDRSAGQGGRGGSSIPSAPAPGFGSLPTTPPAAPIPLTPTTPPLAPTPTGTATADGGQPADASATAVSGTVVHLNPKAGSYTLAADDGRLLAIHSAHAPDPGVRISVETRTLANGTYAEDGDRKRDGNRGQARFSGTVSFRDPGRDMYAVSASGVSALVRGPEGETPPRLGARVEVQGRISPGQAAPQAGTEPPQGCGQPPRQPQGYEATIRALDVTITDGGQGTTPLEGVVQGVCRADHKLVLSADDVRESGADITLAVRGQVSLGKIEPGDVLRLAATLHDNGSYEVTGLASDQNTKDADDPGLIRGDL